MVATAIAPDYALGSHVAALGVAFSSAVMGPQFADGVFVGEHGSWNRNPPSGYKVVFVRFENGQPVGDPIDFVSGFYGEDGLTRGRPVGVTRQMVLDRSSATISAPRGSTVTPTGRPRVRPSSPWNPDTKSIGSPTGWPFLKRTNTTL